MAPLFLVVVLGLGLAYWLMSPLTGALAPLFELHPLPWLLLLAGIWLLAGRPSANR